MEKNTTPEITMSEEGASPGFGIIFYINDSDILVTADSLKDIVKNGIEFELPKPIVFKKAIASIKEFLKSSFGIDFPDLPPPFSTVMEKLEKLNLAIIELGIRVPGSESQEEKQYKLMIEGTWDDADRIPLIPGIEAFGIRGASFGVSKWKDKE